MLGEMNFKLIATNHTRGSNWNWKTLEEAVLEAMETPAGSVLCNID
jgi:hypothetical protein